MTETQVFKVALPAHLYQAFDYLPPSGVRPSDSHLGCRAWLPLRNKRILAVIVGYGASELSIDKLQKVERIVDSSNIFGVDLYLLLLWAADYYSHPLGQVLETALPALLRDGAEPKYRSVTCWDISPAGALQDPEQLAGRRQSQALAALQKHKKLLQPLLKAYGLFPSSMQALARKGWARARNIERKPELITADPVALPTANNEQQAAIDGIAASSGSFARHLLFGVTGSGKTLVFIKLMQQMLADGGQALLLIPEIGLSPQTLHYFAQHIDLPALVLHSGLSERERLDAWLAARSGDVRIVIGTRSALFCPFQDLRLVIVDEEHDSSYKQQDGFRYSARDLAIKRAQMQQVPIVLASATPSLESWAQQRQQSYIYHELPQRAGSANSASFSLLDVRGQKLQHGFSEASVKAIGEQLERGRQVLVFVSRRGFSPVVQCFACGWLAMCPACEQAMTLHQNLRRLLCHHCGHSDSVPTQCPACGSIAIKPLGVGTERGAQYLAERFADYEVIRVDSDTMTKRSAFDQLHATLRKQSACLLIGTQMLAKGHHFPNLTLVVVQDIDSAFYSNDFFAQERVGQLLLQVGGRAGRGEHSGMVVIQTRMPENPLFKSLLEQDYPAFAELLLAERRKYQLAPCSHLAYIRADSKGAEHAYKFLVKIVADLNEQLSHKDLLVLDPMPALRPKRAYYFRFVVVIQSQHRYLRAQALRLAVSLLTQHANNKVRWGLDVDPKEGF